MTIAQELINYIKQTGISQGAVARGIGKSTAVVNQYLQNKYTGDIKAIDALVSAWLLKQRERARDVQSQLVYTYTPTACRIRDVLRLAHLEGETVVLFGQAGLGKTSGLKAYAVENPDSILIESDPTFTAKVLLSSLAVKLGAESTGSLHQISEGVISKLAGSGRIILVDEAENLPLRALECLRRIHDRTGVGLVLAGMPRLLVNLRGRHGELKQLYSRVAFKLDLGDSLPDDELKAIAIESIKELDSAAAAELVAASNGNTRRLAKMVRGVARMAKINNVPIDSEMIRAFQEMLIN